MEAVKVGNPRKEIDLPKVPERIPHIQLYKEAAAELVKKYMYICM